MTAPRYSSLKSSKGLRRSPIGADRRANVQHEAQQAKALEGDSTRLGLFDLHRVDWLHFANVRYDRGSLKSGFPDYFLMGEGWLAFLEIKARDVVRNGRPGKLSAAQHGFHAKLRAAGADVITALLPDDLQVVNLWLRAKTGVVVDADGLAT